MDKATLIIKKKVEHISGWMHRGLKILDYSISSEKLNIE